jgi:glycosyltransferase involved in cell wall biosynthesis
LRVIIFTWEFPPRIVGQLSLYVNWLAVELVRRKVDVRVVTYHDSWNGYHEGADGIKAYRISDPFRPQINILTWALSLDQEVERVAADIYYSVNHEIDLIDVHDWHFVPAAVSLKRALRLPFVFSIDSLEDHRSHGVDTPFNMAIRGIEWLGFYEAKKITVQSEWMQNEVIRLYKVPKEKITLVKQNADSWVKDIIDIYNEVAGAKVNQ